MMSKTLFACTIVLFGCVAASCSAATTLSVAPSTSIDDSWRLLLDPSANWVNDQLYLPENVDLAKMPVNPPTNGWASLTPTAGIPVTLPGTVEQYYWGGTMRPKIDTSDLAHFVTLDGTYKGVSWWYRSFVPPTLLHGQRLVFSFPGARLRAEVYVNGILVGYNIIDEAPFETDATAALRPNENNLIAVRITNPGGTLGWDDAGSFHWGSYVIPLSHSFGGLDAGVKMTVRAPVAVTDLAVFNTPDTKTVKLQADVTSVGHAYSGPIVFAIENKGKPVCSETSRVTVQSGATSTVSVTLSDPNAQEWNVLSPHLYTSTAELPGIDNSGRATTFGFRWFTATGIGGSPRLLLNNRRIVVRSAITWGYFAPNGLFPDADAVKRELDAVRATGLNCIQNHRHMPKRAIVDAFDRAGILLYCEAGAGEMSVQQATASEADDSKPIDTSGASAAANTFSNNYESDKLLAMIRAFRSDPSVIAWNFQNEPGTDLHNPKIFNILRRMRHEDPSRILLFKSGDWYANEAWYLPYSDDLMYDNGDGYSGWHDRHTYAISQGVYADSLYNSPTDYLYDGDFPREINMWGEMATGASLPDYTADLKWYAQHGNSGFDLLQDEGMDTAYGAFLDKYSFRQAYPTNETLYKQIGAKHYFFAAKIMENARINNLNDYIVWNGWESDSSDEDSGLFDTLRLPKSDISPLTASNASVMLVVRPRKYVVATGTAATVDVHLVNTIGLQGSASLEIAASENGADFYHENVPVQIAGGDVFGQLLKSGVAISPPGAGYVTVTATLLTPNHSALTKSEKFLAVDESPSPITTKVALLFDDPALQDALLKKFSVVAAPLSSTTGPVDTIFSTMLGGSSWLSYTGTDAVTNTPDPGLYQTQKYGGPGTIAEYTGLPNGQTTVSLYLAEDFFNQPGQRLFDVALNGTTVSTDFDIFHAAGGENKAVTESFPCTVTDGTLTVSIPKVESNLATVAAIQVTEANGAIIRQVFRDTPFTDTAGNTWGPVQDVDASYKTAVKEALRRVHDDGSRLVAMPEIDDCSDLDLFVRTLADNNVVSYDGMLGSGGIAWLGFWYFSKSTPLLDGLPENCVLDWQYQEQQSNAMKIDAPGIEIPIAEGRDHSTDIGAGAAIIPYGKGQIVLLCMPGVVKGFATGDGSSFDPVTATRIVYNCLQR